LKNIITILLFSFCLTVAGLSQGFDWQYSSRLPFNYPYLFAGLTGSVDMLQHNASLDLSEDNGDCCNFSSGTGIGTRIGLNSEYWLDGLWSANGNLTYLTQRGNFSADGYSLPFSVFDGQGRVIGHDTVSFVNDMSSVINYVTIEFGAKRRLFGSHLFAGASIEAGYQISNTVSQTERVVSPSYYKYNDGSQSRSLGAYEMSELSKFLFIPKLIVGYDLPIGLGLYTSPCVKIGLPLQNTAQTGNWNTWSFSFGISIMRSIAYR